MLYSIKLFVFHPIWDVPMYHISLPRDAVINHDDPVLSTFWRVAWLTKNAHLVAFRLREVSGAAYFRAPLFEYVFRGVGGTQITWYTRDDGSRWGDLTIDHDLGRIEVFVEEDPRTKEVVVKSAHITATSHEAAAELGNDLTLLGKDAFPASAFQEVDEGP